jgi:hypothetical protein
MLADELAHDPELAMYLLTPPVVFQRPFVDITGSITAALVLSMLLQQQEDTRQAPGGWFHADPLDWEHRCGLSGKEQATARRKLLALGLTQEKRVGFPARLSIRLDYDRLAEMLLDSARKRRSEAAHAAMARSAAGTPCAPAPAWVQ